MARTKKSRFIHMAPHYSGFNPVGLQKKCASEVLINLEEYEALNLCNYEMLTQEEAAKMMNVSRPTFTRIYESARQKIAKAFIEGSKIRFEGGSVDVVKWFKCESCKISFTLVDLSKKVCPFCKTEQLEDNN